MRGFSYLLCVIGKLNVKLYELINNYHTDVCFQFHPINSMQGSRGCRILRPGTHKSGSGLLKNPKAESAGHMFFSRGTTTNLFGFFD